MYIDGVPSILLHRRCVGAGPQAWPTGTGSVVGNILLRLSPLVRCAVHLWVRDVLPYIGGS
ncbi:hypothetical protein MNBD_ACTINO01-1133, partial [hydrothermal vent metagenome]